MNREKALHYLNQLGYSSRLLPRGHYPAHDLTIRGDSFGTELARAASPDEAQETAEAEVQQTKNRRPSVSVCISCTCSHPSSATKDAVVEMSSDSDSDEEDLTLERLLQMIQRLERSGHVSPAAKKNFIRLASSLNLQNATCVTDQQTNQLRTFLSSDHDAVKETCLRVLECLLAAPVLCEALLQNGDLWDRLMEMSTGSQTSSPETHVAALIVLDKLLNVPEWDYSLIWQKLDSSVFLYIIHTLHSSAPVEVKYAACCVVRTLARDAHFAARIKPDSLFMLQQLRDSSNSALREVYVGVLMALFTHPGLTEAGCVDTGLLPIIRGLLKDGPCQSQKQALDLLQSAACDGRGVEAVTEDQRIIAYTLACLIHSRCRKVRCSATAVCRTFMSARKRSVVQKVMEGVCFYVQPEVTLQAEVGGGLVAKVKNPNPVRGKHQQDAQLWHYMDCLLDALLGLVQKEGQLQQEFDVVSSFLPVRGAVSQVELCSLTHLVWVVLRVCCWPLHKPSTGPAARQVGREELACLLGDLGFREMYYALNHRQTVEQWHRFGPSLLAVLRWLTQRIVAHMPVTQSPDGSQSKTPTRPSSACPGLSLSSRPGSSCAGSSRPPSSRPPSSRRASSRPTSASSHPSSSPSRPGSAVSCPSLTSFRPSSATSVIVYAGQILSEVELELLMSLLHFTLATSILTCRQIPDPLTNILSGSPRDSEAPKKKAVKSGSSVTDRGADDHRGGGEYAKQQEDKAEKVAMSEQLVVRRGLYREGLFQIVGYLLQLADPALKNLCGIILRTSVQPFSEKQVVFVGGETAVNLDQTSRSLMGPGCIAPRQRSQPETGDVGVKLSIALHRMSPASAAVVKDALDLPSQSESRVASARSNMTGFSASTPVRPASRSRSQPEVNIFKPRMPVSGPPSSRECQREAVACCGADMIQGLFSRVPEVKMSAILFLHDVAKYPAADVLLMLSKLGLMPKLLDFIRVNDKDEQLEVIGLSVVELLIKHDNRLRQLFSRHGGYNLLMALNKHPNMYVHSKVRDIFTLLKRGERSGRRQIGRHRPFANVPTGNPMVTATMTQSDDIWDHIMRRWQEEDKVVQVLQKFL